MKDVTEEFRKMDLLPCCGRPGVACKREATPTDKGEDWKKPENANALEVSSPSNVRWVFFYNIHPPS